MMELLGLTMGEKLGDVSSQPTSELCAMLADQTRLILQTMETMLNQYCAESGGRPDPAALRTLSLMVGVEPDPKGANIPAYVTCSQLSAALAAQRQLLPTQGWMSWLNGKLTGAWRAVQSFVSGNRGTLLTLTTLATVIYLGNNAFARAEAVRLAELQASKAVDEARIAQMQARNDIDRMNASAALAEAEAKLPFVQGIGKALNFVATGVGKGVGDYLTGVGSAASGVGQGLGATASGVGTGLGDTARGIGDGGKSVLVGMGSAVGDAVGGFGRAIALSALAVAGLVGATGYAVGQAPDAAKKLAVGAMTLHGGPVAAAALSAAKFMRRRSPSVSSRKRRQSRQSTPVASRKRRQSSPVASRKRRQSSPVSSRRRRQSPAVSSRKRRQSSPVSSRRRRQSSPVASRKRRQSSPIASLKRLQSPPVASLKRLQSPPVASLKRLQSPPVASRKRRQSPPLSMTRKQRQTLIASPVASRNRRRSPRTRSPFRSAGVFSPVYYPLYSRVNH
jgi:hypothetical protein